MRLFCWRLTASKHFRMFVIVCIWSIATSFRCQSKKERIFEEWHVALVSRASRMKESFITCSIDWAADQRKSQRTIYWIWISWLISPQKLRFCRSLVMLKNSDENDAISWQNLLDVYLKILPSLVWIQSVYLHWDATTCFSISTRKEEKKKEKNDHTWMTSIGEKTVCER